MNKGEREKGEIKKIGRSGQAEEKTWGKDKDGQSLREEEREKGREKQQWIQVGSERHLATLHCL